MIEFVSAESYKIAGRGLLFTVLNPIECERNKNILLGAVIRINGLLYYVRGVESFAVCTLRIGHPLGLLVKLYLGKDYK